MNFYAHTAPPVQQKSRFNQRQLRILAPWCVMMFMGCGVEEKCPQGAYESEDQCLLIEQDGFQVEIPTEGTTAGELTADTVNSPDGSLNENDAADSAAPESSPDVTGWEPEPMTPSWRQWMQPHSTEATLHSKAILHGLFVRASGFDKCEHPDYETGFTEPRSNKENDPLAYEINVNATLNVAVFHASNVTMNSVVDADLRRVVCGTNYVKEDVNQRRCRRESRRDCRRWSSGQSRIGNSLQGAV